MIKLHQVSKKIISFLQTPRPALAGSGLEYLVVFTVLTILTCFYTGGTIMGFDHRLFAFGVGDGTAGFLWLNYADTDPNIMLGWTDWINYPNGFTLGGPTFVTYTLLWVPLWIFSRLINPIVALNLVTFWGFISGGLATYWLLKRLTSNYAVSAIGAFAATVVPYKIINSTNHLAYIFNGIFVLILAAFIGLWLKPSWQRALIMAVMLAIAYYTDGYFLLIATVFLMVLCAAAVGHWLVFNRSWSFLLKRVKYFAVAAIGVVVLMLPVVFTQLYQGAKVSGDLQKSRGNIAYEIAYYAARPIDYLLPPAPHRFINESQTFQQLNAYKSGHSNPVENTLYLGYALLLPCLLASLFLLNKKLRAGLIDRLSSDKLKMLVFVMPVGVVVLAALIYCSFPPDIAIRGHILPTLSGMLIGHDIALWRVLARFFLPIHAVLVVLSGLALWLIFKMFNSSIRAQSIVATIVIGLLSFEYATTFNSPAFDFNSLPKGYVWLKQQSDIKVIAEFPMVDKPFDISYKYVTAQIVHGKKLVNSHQPLLNSGGRNVFGTIDNSDAIDFAIARGAQAIISYSLVDCQADYSWGELAYSGAGWDVVANVNQNFKMCIYTKLRPNAADKLFARLGDGFDDNIYFYKNKYYNLLQHGAASVIVVDENDQPIKTSILARFKAQLQNTPDRVPSTGNWAIFQDQKLIAGGDYLGSSQPIEAIIDASQPIDLRFEAIGGVEPTLFQLSLNDIVISAN